MVHIKRLTDDQARTAMAENEFGSDVLESSELVAVILTQGWCPQWSAMNEWLEQMSRDGEPREFDLDVFVLVYDGTPYFAEFMRFKEWELGNSQIPYVRYYRKSKLFAESNYVSEKKFVKTFQKGIE